MVHLRRAVGLLALAGLAACGSGGAGSSAEVFCDQMVSGIHLCAGQSYTGASAADESGLTMGACTQAGGKIVTGCPTTGLLGDCTTTVTTGAVSGTIDMFSYVIPGESTAMQAATYQASCVEHGGTWKSAP